MMIQRDLGDGTYANYDEPASPAVPRFPEVELHLSTGHDGNVGAIMGSLRQALRQAGVPGYNEIMAETYEQVFQAGSYDETLNIIMRLVNVT